MYDIMYIHNCGLLTKVFIHIMVIFNNKEISLTSEMKEVQLVQY